MLPLPGQLKFRMIDALRKRKIPLLFFVVCAIIAGFIFFLPARGDSEVAGRGLALPTNASLSLIPSSPPPGPAEQRVHPTASPTIAPTGTPLPIPHTGVIWNQKAAGVYLWDSPGGAILKLLPNGAMVTLLDERQIYGGLPWISIQHPDGEGWMVQTQVFRGSDPPVAYVAGEGWTNLRDRPQGWILQVLPTGTPILSILGDHQGDGGYWTQVKLPNGVAGWVVTKAISTGRP